MKMLHLAEIGISLIACVSKVTEKTNALKGDSNMKQIVIYHCMLKGFQVKDHLIFQNTD
jgi:hypothetical protein